MDVAEQEPTTETQPESELAPTHHGFRIGITGASGFVGSHLIAEASRQGMTCVGYSRDPQKSIAGCAEVRQLDDDPGSGLPDLSGLDAVVNLAGASILGLWSTRRKELMRESRVQTTRKIVAAMKALPADDRPKAFTNASGIHVYGECGDDLVTEEHPPDPGDNFLAEVSRLTEGSAMQAEEFGVRVTPLRISMVLGVEAGAFPLMHGVFSKGLGGNLGSGKQWMSWIHATDLARLILFCLTENTLSGPVNATSPRSVRNEEFTRTLADALNRPAILHTPALALKLLLGEMSTTALTSVRGVPQKAAAAGFTFNYPELDQALRDLLARM